MTKLGIVVNRRCLLYKTKQKHVDTVKSGP